MDYVYQKAPVDGAALQAEALAAGLPVDHVNTTPSSATVVTTRDLTPAELATLDGVVLAHVPPTKDQRRRDAGIAFYDSPDSPEALVERSGQEALLALVNELQRKAGINETGAAQLRNATRAIIKPGG